MDLDVKVYHFAISINWLGCCFSNHKALQQTKKSWVIQRSPAFSLAVFLNFNSGAKWGIQALPREVFCWLWEELVLVLFATFPSQWRCFLIAQARSVKRKIHIAKTGGKIDRVQRLLDQCFPLENHWLFPCYSLVQEEEPQWFHYWGKWEFTFRVSALVKQKIHSTVSVYWTQSYCKDYHIWSGSNSLFFKSETCWHTVIF